MGVLAMLSPFKWLRWTVLALVLVSTWQAYQWVGPSSGTPDEANDAAAVAPEQQHQTDADPDAAIAAPEPKTEAEAEARRGGWPWRIGLWLAAVAAAPWLLRPLIVRALECESNAVTGLTLAGFAVAAWLLAMGLGGFDFSGWLVPVLALVGFAAATAYFYTIFARFEADRL